MTKIKIEKTKYEKLRRDKKRFEKIHKNAKEIINITSQVLAK